MSQLAPATRISQQGRVYKTRKAAQGQADFLAGEVDLGWFVLEVTRGHFIVARPYVEGDERHDHPVHTLARGA